jgi:hypothetical protein
MTSSGDLPGDEHAPRLLHGLLPNGIRLLAQRANGGSGVLGARFGLEIAPLPLR